LTAVPAAEPFDVVASNPPYVSQSEWDRLPPDVRNYEPRSSLVGGATGSETIARLIPQAAELLRPGGWLLLEISPMIEAACNTCSTATAVSSPCRRSGTWRTAASDQGRRG